MRRSIRWLLPFVLGILVPALSAAAERSFRGAAGMYGVPELTIVYPVEGNVEENRLSAERRAAFLSAVHGVSSRVAADDALEEGQLSQDLLLLGWGNSLLERLPAVLDRDGERPRLFGEIPVVEGEDLLFGIVSPFSAEHRLFFWSRIDLPKDRFAVLPFVGSDWAIYRDFVVVQQGMFELPLAYPPIRSVFGEADHRADLFVGKPRISSERFDLHDTTTGLEKEELETILGAREQAFGRAEAALGPAPEDLRISLFVYEDAIEKEEFCGVPDPTHSLPGRREIHMTRRRAVVPTPHEEIHILARERYGPTIVTALYEGLAVALEQEPGSQELTLFAVGLLDHERFPTVAELLDEEFLRRLTKSGTGFPAAGLLVRWILETGDETRLNSVYGVRVGSLEDVANRLGKPPDEVEAAFRTWVEKLAEGSREEFEFRKAIEESKVLTGAGNFVGAAKTATRALELRPGDLPTLYRLSLAEMRSGAYAGARRHLQAMLDSPAMIDERRSLVYYQLGRLHDVQGEREEAIASYQRALELPDFQGSHRKSGVALQSPATKESLLP